MKHFLPLLAAFGLFSFTTFADDQQGLNRGDPTIDPMLVAAGFLDSHPDLRWRTWALDDYGRKNHTEALRKFKRASYYADKPSQAIVGEMLWIGLGANQDRALAYVWMELAAERGYRSFVDKRDLYWSNLNAIERERARAEAPALRAEYADTVAEPRLAITLERERRQLSGSRLGSQTSNVQVMIPGVGSIDASQYYNPKYWDPKLYREWHDSIWTDLYIPRVNVGEIEQVKDPASNADAPAADRNP